MKLRTATFFAMAWMLGLGAAQAAPCTPGAKASARLGGASTDDVTLHGAAADQCHVSLNNAQSGPYGDSSAFATALGSGWSLLAKIDERGQIIPDPATAGPASLDLGFARSSTTAGTWSITSNRNITLDLVFAMHAGSATGAFLFDNESLVAGMPAAGAWAIEWTNNGRQVPAYSNLTLFYRDVSAITPPPPPPSEVPVPGVLGLLAAGVAGVAFSRRRTR